LKPFSNSTSIFKFEFGDENGLNLKFASFQNYSRFYTKTLKNQNTKLVAPEKIYKLCFKLFLQFCLDFELFKRGKIRVLNLGFPEEFQIEICCCFNW
jgi:hypothetical protein